MRLKTELYRRGEDEPAGTIEWDSENGQLGGSLADEVRREAVKAEHRGFVYTIDPIPGGFRVAITAPLQLPTEFAALLASMDLRLPEQLKPHAPIAPTPRSPDWRRRRTIIF